MQLRFQDKEYFFHNLAQVLDSGIPIQNALKHLAAGRDRAALIAKKLLSGEKNGISPALAETGFSQMDAEICAAGEQSGCIVTACKRLSEYYSNLAAGRRRILTASAYPLFVFHLGAVILSVPTAVLKGEFAAFFGSIFSILGVAYAVAGGCILLLSLARRVFRSRAGASRMILKIPVLGDLLLTAALSRFCLVLSLGIRSADGILASLSRAGRASQSAWIAAASEKAVSDIRQGASFAEALRHSDVFPADLERGFETAEISGRLDEEMSRWADIYRNRFFARVEVLSSWLPRLIYLGVLLLITIRIFDVVSQMSGAFSEALDYEN